MPRQQEAEQESAEIQGVSVGIVGEAVGLSEQRIEGQPDRDEIDHRNPDHAGSIDQRGEPGPQRFNQARPRHQGDHHQAVDRDVVDEPQVVHRHAVHQAVGTELMHQPAAVVGAPPVVVHRLDPGLDRHQHEDSHQERRPETVETGPEHLAGRAARRHEGHGAAGDEEQQRQPPGSGQGQQLRHPTEPVLGLDVPVVGRIDERRVEQDQQAERDHPDPVQVGAAARGWRGRRRHGRVCGAGGNSHDHGFVIAGQMPIQSGVNVAQLSREARLSS